MCHREGVAFLLRRDGGLADDLLGVLVEKMRGLLERGRLAVGGEGRVLVGDGIRRHIPDVGHAFDHLPAHVIGGLVRGKAGGKGDPAAARDVGVADGVGVDDHRNDVVEADPQGFGELHGDRRPSAADVGRAFEQRHRAVRIQTGDGG